MATKFQYISNLHLEFPSNRRFLKQYPIQPKGDILLVAGDFAYTNIKKGGFYVKDVDKYLDFFSKNFKQTFIILGNYEYYTSVNCKPLTMEQSKKLCIPIRKNVTVLNNALVYLWKDKEGFKYSSTKPEGIRSTVYRIFGCTLWSDIPEQEKSLISRNMNDYYYGHYSEDKVLTPNDTVAEHKNSIELIRNISPNKGKEKLIVISHHLPSFDLIDNSYQYNKLNSAYASNIDSEILSKVDAWVFGHSHAEQQKMINEKKYYEASLGYTDYMSSTTFAYINRILGATFTL